MFAIAATTDFFFCFQTQHGPEESTNKTPGTTTSSRLVNKWRRTSRTICSSRRGSTMTTCTARVSPLWRRLPKRYCWSWSTRTRSFAISTKLMPICVHTWMSSPVLAEAVWTFVVGNLLQVQPVLVWLNFIECQRRKTLTCFAFTYDLSRFPPTLLSLCRFGNYRENMRYSMLVVML